MSLDLPPDWGGACDMYFVYNKAATLLFLAEWCEVLYQVLTTWNKHARSHIRKPCSLSVLSKFSVASTYSLSQQSVESRKSEFLYIINSNYTIMIDIGQQYHVIIYCGILSKFDWIIIILTFLTLFAILLVAFINNNR